MAASTTAVCSSDSTCAPNSKAARSAKTKLSLLELSFWLPFNIAFSALPFVWSFGWITGLQGPSTRLPVASQMLQLAAGMSRGTGVGYSEKWSCGGAFAWDFMIFMLFGSLHSAMASITGKTFARRFVPPQVIPTLFAAVSNVELMTVASCWASCPGALWDFRESPAATVAIEAAKTTAIVLLAIHMLHFDPLEIFGTTCLFLTAEEAEDEMGMCEGRGARRDRSLITSGFFRFVRCNCNFKPFYRVG
eukprot:tig00001487_g8935.t1